MVPPVGLVILALTWSAEPPAVVQVLVAVVLVGAVLSAVHHAEVVAHRVGEPYGSLILALAVTVIEVGLIITLMVAGASGSESLARDTTFAALMITTNGVAGLVLLLGAVRGHVARFNPAGTATALSAGLTLVTLTLVLPRFTTTESGPVFSGAQLAFAAVAAVVIYVLFVLVQNVRHRDYFLPRPASGPDGAAAPGGAPTGADDDASEEQAHAETPSPRAAAVSAGLLVAALVAVVGLAKVESPAVEAAVAAAGLPASFVGVVIAVVVLAPETISAARNALHDRVQIGLNLAYGSAAASIGLTVPAIAVASIWLPGELALGLAPLQIALLALTAVVSVLTVLPGRATVLQGGLHLVLCAAFLYFAAFP